MCLIILRTHCLINQWPLAHSSSRGRCWAGDNHTMLSLCRREGSWGRQREVFTNVQLKLRALDHGHQEIRQSDPGNTNTDGKHTQRAQYTHTRHIPHLIVIASERAAWWGWLQILTPTTLLLARHQDQNLNDKSIHGSTINNDIFAEIKNICWKLTILWAPWSGVSIELSAVMFWFPANARNPITGLALNYGFQSADS